jgi:hypothetical protein
MKDIHKHPLFYYLLVMGVTALWPLAIGGIHLPSAQRSREKEMGQFEEAKAKVREILKLDPERLNYSDKKGGGEFEYYRAVEQVARLVGIPAANYTLSSQPPRTSQGQKIQTCRLELKEVGVKDCAEFLSLIQLRWTSLECEQIMLTRKKDKPDAWKVNLRLKYYF